MESSAHDTQQELPPARGSLLPEVDFLLVVMALKSLESKRICKNKITKFLRNYQASSVLVGISRVHKAAETRGCRATNDADIDIEGIARVLSWRRTRFWYSVSVAAHEVFKRMSQMAMPSSCSTFEFHQFIFSAGCCSIIRQFHFAAYPNYPRQTLDVE